MDGPRESAANDPSTSAVAADYLSPGTWRPAPLHPGPFPELLRIVWRLSDSPVLWREIASLLLLVGLFDAVVYRGNGYAGFALLFVAAPVLLACGAPRILYSRYTATTFALLAALSLKLLWCGAAWHVLFGMGLLVGFAMTLSGMRPYVLESMVFGAQTRVAGGTGLLRHFGFLTAWGPRFPRVAWLNYLIPAAALGVFGMIFILANPDLLSSFGSGFQQFARALREWMSTLWLRPSEVIFWGVVLWFCAGLLRPVVDPVLTAETSGDDLAEKGSSPAFLYIACRNTLATVIALFAVYLVFEFATLWFRDFPDGFYYAGYAHEGAAWLTVALALATATLSLVFRGAVLNDPRLAQLRRLAWVWSIENVVLAIAVYNRMYIYINFNGMTRMRMVGLFGISAVVAGFLLVLWKIAHTRDFVWLVRRQLWALALTIYLFALTPIDMFVMQYNVARIGRGDLASSVQIIAHPVDSQGLLTLSPLLECADPLIREGVRALLAERLDELEDAEQRRESQSGNDWTAYQLADQRLLSQLRADRARVDRFKSRAEVEKVKQAFYDHAYQWY